MRAILEYDAHMRRWTSVSAFFIIACFVAAASAQVNGVPPSVTSFGFGGHVLPNAPRASVTSLGPNGWTAAPPGTPPYSPHHPGHGSPYGHGSQYTYPYYPAYYPYYSVTDPTVYGGPLDGAPVADDDQYMGGPTIFDRRGDGQYIRPAAPPPGPSVSPDRFAADAMPAPEAPPEPPQPDTVLIFKDGHKQQVSNYAIVGANLFDLSNGRRQKIALSDLDVDATQKANEDQGIDFRLPSLPTGS